MTPIVISSLEYINQAAQQFISQMGDSTVFAFFGRMGAGKTTFIKAVCQQLGVTDDVTSPTFAIVNEYLDAQSRPIYHFDFYRIKRLEEALGIGLEDYVYSGNVCLMEWPEMIGDLLPDDACLVSIEEQPDGSRVISDYVRQ